MCIEVDPTSFPDGQENGYMFPKGTVVTLLGHGKKGKRVGFRDTHENVYVAKLGFADNAFNPLEAGLPREEMPLHSYDPNIRLLGKKSMPQYVDMVRDKYDQPPFSEKELNKQTPYVLGRKEKLYNDFKWKQYIPGFEAASNEEKRQKYFKWAAERLVPVGVLAEAVCLAKNQPKVVPIAVKGVCEVALAADFGDPQRVLPKPGQVLYLTIDGAIDQGQRGYLHLLLKGHNNIAWLNALRIKVVVAPTASEKTVLAVLP